MFKDKCAKEYDAKVKGSKKQMKYERELLIREKRNAIFMDGYGEFPEYDPNLPFSLEDLVERNMFYIETDTRKKYKSVISGEDHSVHNFKNFRYVTDEEILEVFPQKITYTLEVQRFQLPKNYMTSNAKIKNIPYILLKMPLGYERQVVKDDDYARACHIKYELEPDNLSEDNIRTALDEYIKDRKYPRPYAKFPMTLELFLSDFEVDSLFHEFVPTTPIVLERVVCFNTESVERIYAKMHKLILKEISLEEYKKSLIPLYNAHWNIPFSVYANDYIKISKKDFPRLENAVDHVWNGDFHLRSYRLPEEGQKRVFADTEEIRSDYNDNEPDLSNLDPESYGFR